MNIKSNLLCIGEKCKPEYVFVCLACIFGLSVMIITPPFQVPDEPNHFYRAYQISEGKFIAEKVNNRLGGYVPASLAEISDPFTYLFWNKRAKINKEVICSRFEKPLNRNNRIFADFPNTAVYSAVSYAPQATGIFLLRLADLPPLYLFYGARLFAFLFWVVSLFFVIKLLPVGKWLFTFLFLLPMSVYVNSSLSADIVSNVLSFWVVALILRTAFEGKAFRGKSFLFLLALVILLALAKIVYVSLILLFLLVPLKNYASKRVYFFQFGLLLVTALVVVVVWSNVVNHLYLPYRNYNVQFRDNYSIQPGANMMEQMQYLVHHKFHIIRVLKNTIIHTSRMYFPAYIARLGWLDTKFPSWFIVVNYICIVWIALSDTDRTYRFNLFQKVLLAITSFVVFCLVAFSQYLAWETVGSDVVAVIQGRYLIPAVPLIFLMFFRRAEKKIPFLVPAVVLLAVFNLSFTLTTLYSRYYKQPVNNLVFFKSSAEEISDDIYFKTDNPDIYMEGAYSRSDDQKHSGKYSVKLSPYFSTGLTYRILDAHAGDSVKVEVWRKNKGGGIDISGGTDFKVQDTTSVERDSLGWERLVLHIRIPNDLPKEMVRVCVFNNSPNILYFDDISVEYKRRSY